MVPENLKVETTKNEPTQKEKRIRSVGAPSFPRDSLTRTLTIAKAIEENNAGKPYDRLDLAKATNWSPNSSGFRILIISSARYGLTAGSYIASNIALTPLGSAIVAPTDSNTGIYLRQALLRPDLFHEVYSFYDKKQIPREEFFKNSLRKQFKVAPEDVEACHKVIMENITDFALANDIKGNQFLQLDKLGTSAQTLPDEEQVEVSETENTAIIDTPEAIAPPSPQELKPRVFISHSKNMKILEQIKQMLTFGGFENEVAVETETTAIPIPEKIFGMMRKCDCAVINVSADEQEKREDGSYSINQNVLIEIGAAFLQYNKRVILLVDKRIKLPSNLQGLYRSSYEGDELSWDTGMKLQKALTEFRNII